MSSNQLEIGTRFARVCKLEQKALGEAGLNLQRAERAWGFVLNASRRRASNKEALRADLCPAEGEEGGVGRDVLPPAGGGERGRELRWAR